MPRLKKETQELIDLFKDYKQGSKSYERKPFDENHWFRRMFRLYIDGSHSYPNNMAGYKFVEQLRKRFNEDRGNEGKLRSLVIQMFLDMMQVEFPTLSRSTIQKTITQQLKGIDLNKFNSSLIEDLIEKYEIEKI